MISLLLMMLAGFGMLIRNAGTNTALTKMIRPIYLRKGFIPK